MGKSEVKFKIGDVVKLKSGGPKMTVNSFSCEHEKPIEDIISGGLSSQPLPIIYVGCRWFVNYINNEAIFHQNALEEVGKNHTPLPVPIKSGRGAI